MLDNNQSRQSFIYVEGGQKIISAKTIISNSNNEKLLIKFIKELSDKGIIDLNKFKSEIRKNIHHSFNDSLDDVAQLTLNKIDEYAEKTNNKLDEYAEKTAKFIKG